MKADAGSGAGKNKQEANAGEPRGGSPDALLSQRALDYLIATRRLPTRRIGGRVLIPVSELRKYARTDHPERIVS
jgi:hypothetical protein